MRRDLCPAVWSWPKKSLKPRATWSDGMFQGVGFGWVSLQTASGCHTLPIPVWLSSLPPTVPLSPSGRISSSSRWVLSTHGGHGDMGWCRIWQSDRVCTFIFKCTKFTAKFVSVDLIMQSFLLHISRLMYSSISSRKEQLASWQIIIDGRHYMVRKCCNALFWCCLQVMSFPCKHFWCCIYNNNK